MTRYNPDMVAAIANLSTERWGEFFFAIPARIRDNSVTPCDIQSANTARVFVPDASLSLAQPPFGVAAWDTFGAMGIKSYSGVLIPLETIKELNPGFDYHKVLRSCQRRNEYEQMVVQHIAEVQQALKERVTLNG